MTAAARNAAGKVASSEESPPCDEGFMLRVATYRECEKAVKLTRL